MIDELQSKSLTEWVDDILLDVQSILLSFLIRLGPFFIALMPAMFTGYSVFDIFKEQYTIAVTFALIVGFSLEAVGILATHTSVDLYNAWKGGDANRGKFILMTSMVPVYIVAVDGVVIYSHAYEPVILGIAIASPWLTCISYLAIALTADVRNVRKQKLLAKTERSSERRERRETDLERFRIEQEVKAKVEIARIETSAKVSEPSQKWGESDAESNGNHPEWLTVIPKDRKHFRQLVKTGELSLPDSVTGAELAKSVPSVGSPRTGQNWLSDVKNGNH